VTRWPIPPFSLSTLSCGIAARLAWRKPSRDNHYAVAAACWNLMEEIRRSIRLSGLAPLLFILPVLGLTALSLFASSLYATGIEDIQYYHRNIYWPWLIGWIVWAVAAAALVIAFVVEVVLVKIGRAYKFPSVSLLIASTWNLLIGEVTFFYDYPFQCGFEFDVPPSRIFSNSMYYVAMTFGLLLAGIAAIKFNSIDGGFVKLAKRTCLLNGILALLGMVPMFLTACFID
jgi:hypothetical protein